MQVVAAMLNNIKCFIIGVPCHRNGAADAGCVTLSVFDCLVGFVWIEGPDAAMLFQFGARVLAWRFRNSVELLAHI